MVGGYVAPPAYTMSAARPFAECEIFRSSDDEPYTIMLYEVFARRSYAAMFGKLVLAICSVIKPEVDRNGATMPTSEARIVYGVGGR